MNALVLSSLARFRADPRRVRVSIRHSGSGLRWIATVNGFGGGLPRSASSDGMTPESAVISALTIAERMGVEGIDLDMQWTYVHPWRTA